MLGILWNHRVQYLKCYKCDVDDVKTMTPNQVTC